VRHQDQIYCDKQPVCALYEPHSISSGSPSPFLLLTLQRTYPKVKYSA